MRLTFIPSAAVRLAAPVETQLRSKVPSAFRFKHVILQPTTGCNLNCSYCYLPDRRNPQVMSVDVASAVANALASTDFVYVLWHGGEPLSCGLNRFRELVRPFAPLRAAGRIQHSLQTNGTLITERWCEFFKEESFRVGVSVDGSGTQNGARLNWNGRSSLDASLRGMDELRRAGIRFGVISVVNRHNIDDPEGLYEFLASLGARGLNFNIEEREGLNESAVDLEPDRVATFWTRLFNAWRTNPVVPIREFENVLGWMLGVCSDQAGAQDRPGDIWPTVSAEGDVVVLSPEFMGTDKARLPAFVVGNVLQRPLTQIIADCGGTWYVQDYFEGREVCRRSCPYFSFCGGGQPSNKYFELGTLKGTETAYCRNTKQIVVAVILRALSQPQEGAISVN